MWGKIQKAIQRAAENILSLKKRTPELLKLQLENEKLKSLKRNIKTTRKETTSDREDPTDKLAKEWLLVLESKFTDVSSKEKIQDEQEEMNTRTELKL
ncbi:7450_t:CDS:2 [Dentiscutata heterogama]|uniref:7450_t:CDS:1 n=1 Tax=Dentiscutata heterogama TaxID=1316150 RepID=A0ACA9KDV6_9GLOM|nr:7450_t:CDS:2 [Dentiscutata heterogama]